MGRFGMAAEELSSRARASAWGEHHTASHHCSVQTVCMCWVALGVTTAVAAAAGFAWPGLVPSTPPHATLRVSTNAIASILFNNARVLTAPFILVVARFARARMSRAAADTIVAAILVGNAIAIGLALGRWRDALLPYVPQLPLEYLAAATAAAFWIGARRPTHPLRPRHAVAYAAWTVTLAASAAAIEVLLSPHAR